MGLRRSIRSAVAAAVAWLAAGAAIAGVVTATVAADFDDDSALKVNTRTDLGASVRLDVVDTVVDDWYRGHWDGAVWEVQAQHDDDVTFFTEPSRCLRTSQNPSLMSADPVALGGFLFRTGPADYSPLLESNVSSIAAAAPLALPAGLDTIDEVRFATLGAHLAARSYTVTFHYQALPDAARVATIQPDSVNGVARDSSAVGVTVTNVAGLVHNSFGLYDANGDLKSDCAGSGGDVVTITNPNPTAVVESIEFDFPAYGDLDDNLGWLGGPIGVSLVTDRTQIEAAYVFSGEYGSPTDTVDAVASLAGPALWFDVVFHPPVSAGSSVALHVACGDDPDADGSFEESEYTAPELTLLLEDLGAGSSVPFPSPCAGKYLHYRLELVDEFADTTAADPLRVDDLSFGYDLDLDRDGYGATGSAGPWDCDDSDPATHPGVVDSPGDGIDSNCDGGETCFRDADGDGYRGTTAVASSDADCTDPGEVTASVTVDCDDTRSSVYPGASEGVGDGVDSDCDGVDLCFLDADGDGNRSTTVVLGTTPNCSGPSEASNDADANPVDCDDTDPDRFVGNLEVVGDEKDQDCDGAEICWPDLDDDHHRATTGSVASPDPDCDDTGEAPTTAGDDCDDDNPTVHVDAAETCAAADQNCDGDPYAGAIDGVTVYDDGDDDGWGDWSAGRTACGAPPPHTASEGGDCDDGDPEVHPGATDPCDGVDQDCGGADGDGTSGDPWFADGDQDGHGAVAADPVFSCASLAPEYAPVSDDCDDADPEVHPGRAELCNAADDDCDGAADEGCPDLDGDGTPAPADCDDADPTVHPRAQEDVGPVDRDCDGLSDPDTPFVAPGCGCRVAGGSPGLVLAWMALLVRRYRKAG